RQAILDAENGMGSGIATIDFAIPGTGVQTITPLSPLPALTTSILIDGFSQPGYAGSPLVELSGKAAEGDGLTINSSGSTIRGLAIDGFQGGAAIVISGPDATGNAIEANFLGVDLSGPSIRHDQVGISITAGAHDNTIGGTATGAGNLIKGDGTGILV